MLHRLHGFNSSFIAGRMVSVRRSSVKTNRVIFRVGVNEAEDAVAIGGVGADDGPVGSAEICGGLNQARLVGTTIASKLKAAASQHTTNENSTRFRGACHRQRACADFLVGTGT